ncbi:MAG TPA: GAF domain-containing sensor histidine kinase, partial [Candidatus Acidoferrales bacterium]|nr:GAF domain-containing sensor histidine kinase [Candidatus Acidoferrales bacterium]
FRMVRSVRQAMLSTDGEAYLLDEICRILIQCGLGRIAWVVMADVFRREFRRVAFAGWAEDVLADLPVRWADKLCGSGPVVSALRAGRSVVCNNLGEDARFAPWHRLARRLGLGSLAALPLVLEGRAIGVLVISAAETNAFDDDDQLFLTDLTDDLAVGVGLLRERIERQRLQEEAHELIEREQERIGRDLHDHLCQLLVGAKCRSAVIQELAAHQLPAAGREAVALEKILNQAIQQTRDLAFNLNPLKLTAASLPAALRGLAKDVEHNHGPRCYCQVSQPVKISDGEVPGHLYRIAQEAVQNAMKHARAKNLFINLAQRRDAFILSIQDDGVGMVRGKKPGMGLQNMQARARLIGGRLEVLRRRPRGTVVRCHVRQSSD